MLGKWELSWNKQRIILENQESKRPWTYELTQPTYCSHCGRSLLRGKFCWDKIRHENLQFAEKVFQLGLYYPRYKLEEQPQADILTQHILALKDDHEFSQPIGESMAMTLLNNYREMLDADFLVPVPSYGNNSDHSMAICEVISEHIRKVMNIKIKVQNALKKILDTKLHMLPSGPARKEMVNDMFVSNEGISVTGKNIILVDDLLTTGDAKSKCMKILKLNGAKKIWVYVAAGT